MAAQDATHVLKRELRKRVRATLKSIPRQQIVLESEYLRQVLQSHTSYKNARTIAMYASQPTEMDTSQLITDALNAQKRVFLPRVLSKTSRGMTMLEVKSLQDLGSFDRGAYSIPEPPLNDGRTRAPDNVGLDLVIVPGVAFDNSGHRLGHGMGFYDIFLQNYRKRVDQAGGSERMPVLIALAMSPQMVAHVPTDELDWEMDEVIAAPSPAK